MGINAIKCEGYGEVRESGFGKGKLTSSDFDKEDLKGVLTLAFVAAVGTVTWYLSDNNTWWPADKTEPVPARLHGRYTEIAFRNGGQTERVDSPIANNSYLMEFKGASQGFIDSAKFDIRNVNTSEARTVTFYQGNSVQIDGALTASMEIDGIYVKLTIKEME